MKQFAAVILMVISAITFGKDLEYIAHRGASYLAPENTMASVKLAWRLGADSVEVDVYLASDEQIVVIHDDNTKRTSGGTELKVESVTSEELRKLDVGSFKDEKYAGEKIPFLKEVIDSIPTKRKLYIEIKCDVKVLPYLKKLIEQSGKAEQIVVISFDFDVVKEFKKTMPQIPVYWLVGTRKDKETKKELPHDPAWIDKAVEHKIDGLDLHYAGLNEEFAKAAIDAGLKLYVWTVNDPAIVQKMSGLGVEGITTDRPKWLKREVKKAMREEALLRKKTGKSSSR